MLELVGVNFTEVGGWSLLILTWGFIVFAIVKGILYTKPHVDNLQKTLDTERASRQLLESAVKEQNAALTAIADGVESIKRATTRTWWGGRREGGV